MSKAAIQASVLLGTTTISVAGGASITVRNPDGTLASLWQDRAGTTPQAQPVTADAAGAFLVYATPGRYTVTAVSGADSRAWTDVVVHATSAEEAVAAHEDLAEPHSQYATDVALDAHTGDETNPHSVTYTQAGAAAEVHDHTVDEVSGAVAPDAVDLLAPALVDGILEEADGAVKIQWTTARQYLQHGWIDLSGLPSDSIPMTAGEPSLGWWDLEYAIPMEIVDANTKAVAAGRARVHSWLATGAGVVVGSDAYATLLTPADETTVAGAAVLMGHARISAADIASSTGVTLYVEVEEATTDRAAKYLATPHLRLAAWGAAS